jgi:D-alanine-D-alanine ligase
MTSSKLKVAVLYDVLEEGAPEPEPEPEKPARRKARKKALRKKKKEKHDREEIFEALEKLGYEPFYQVVDGRAQSLNALAKCGADLVFNLVESYAGDDTKDMNMAAYLDLLGLAYTGSGPHGLFLAQDKSIAKKLFSFHGVSTPFFAMSYRGRLDHAHDVKFPLIVKPVAEDGSIGIDNSSVVASVSELLQKIHDIHEEFDSPALIEEYIEGREIYAAVLGSYENCEALPLIELDLSKLPKGTPRIAGQDVKFEKETEAYKLTKSAPVEDLDEETTKRLTDTALGAYRACKLRDYGRIDMRLNDKGEIFVIEANPNPWLASTQEFAMAAKKSGRTYTELIGEIVDMARTRYGIG